MIQMLRVIISIYRRICYNKYANNAKGDSIMAYRYAQREQMELFPQAIEDYVTKDDPVRAYDTFVEALDFTKLGIALDENHVGNPQYDPKAMVKLLVYGYSYGIRSSRKLERAVYHNISFIWLMGALKPDHKTIANFRRHNTHTLKQILKQCAHLCMELGLIEGNTLFTDGTKIRSNASIKNTWTKEKCNSYLKHIDKHIESILSECEKTDEVEQNQSSLVKMKQTLLEQEILKTKVKDILKKLDEDNKKSINTIDPDAVRINSVHGSHAGYNAQIVVDEKHGLIVHSDVTSTNNDTSLLTSQITQANETLGKKCKAACSDTGYFDTDDLDKLFKQGIQVIVPSKRQASKKGPKEFEKERFKYDDKSDSYVCPEGHTIKYSFTNNNCKNRVYRISKSSICRKCRHFGKCTKSKRGRTILTQSNEHIRKKLESDYMKPQFQAIYSLRKQKVELPFGHIRRNLKVDAFLLRGSDGAKLEMSLLTSCFNISRIITIFGVRGFIQQMKESLLPLQKDSYFNN